jgi:hypothetical protein
MTASGNAPPITPPRPDLVRRPAGGFGWLEDRLLHDGWLARLGPPAVGVLVLLALAADRNGCSFYGRRRMAVALGIRRQDLDEALRQLRQLNLVVHRPWRSGHHDGVWQLLPVPGTPPPARPPPQPLVHPRCRIENPHASAPPVLGEALQQLARSLAAAHGFPVIQPDSSMRAHRRESALPDGQ